MLLLLASYVTIGRILISNVDTYRSQVTQLLTDSLGAPAHIGELTGEWAYLDPTLQIDRLTIGKVDSIKLRSASVTVDVIASLRERSLILRQASVEGLRLIIERDADRWQVMGLPPSAEPFDIEPLLRSVDYLVDLRLSDIEVEVLGLRSSFVVRTTAKPVEVRRVGEMLSLAVPLQVQDENGSHNLLLAGQFQGEHSSEESSSELYLNLPQLAVTEFVPASQLETMKVDNVNIGGEIWVSMSQNDIDLKGKTHIALNFSSAEHDLWSDQVFALKGHLGGELIGTIAQIQGDFAGVDWRFENIGMSYQPGPDGNQLAIQIPELNVAEMLMTPIELGRLGIGLGAEQLETLVALSPAGQLKSVMAIVEFGETLDYRIVSSLDSVSVQPYKALPVISDLNGMVQIGPENGFLDIINERSFSLQFPNLFEEQWHFDEARTRVTYDISDAGIQAQTGLVEARWGELVANGKVHLRLPGDPLETTWGLELGVQHANLLDAFRYLPTTLKQDVREWLGRAILGGQSNESGMLFHGSLARQAPKDQKAHQLYFEVTDSILDYDPTWPRFDELDATIFIDNFEISSDDAAGRIFDSEVYDSTVMVPVSAEGVADSILIDGKVRGLFSDGVRILTETPLAEATSYMAADWIAEGDMTGHAKMNIPIGPRSERGEAVWADVGVDLDGASVEMGQFDLKFDDVRGSFRYETNTAMESKLIEANLFGQPVVGNIVSEGDVSAGEIIVHLDGAIGAEDLYTWSDQPLLTRAEGLMSYQSDLHLFYGLRANEPIFVTATSDLSDVDLLLPEPLGKSGEDKGSLFYKQTFFDSGYQIDLELGEAVQASLHIIDDTIAGGRINFGTEPFDDVSYHQLKVTGQLERVLYEQWEALSNDLESKSEGSLEEELEQTLDDVNLEIGFFDVFGFEMDQVQTRITRSSDFWHVDLKNDWLEGRVSVSDDDLAPLEINMKSLVFDSNDSEVGSDPFSDVSPADLALARFSVDQLTLDEEDYGSWAFLYEPDQHVARLSGLEIDVRGLRVAEDASVTWSYLDGEHKSVFDGTVLVPDLGLALREWGYASSIEGQDFSLYGDVTWPGSPAMVDLDVIDGLIRVMKGEGRFVQADNNMGALRLLGIFDFASLARRFRLDFSDVVNSGFSFSSVEGETRFSSGIVDVVDPILIEGSGSTFKVAGRIDLTSRKLDNDMIVTLPINRNLPWYAAYSAFATGPLTGAGVFIAQRVFQNQINAISSAKYKITGTMDEPIIEFVSIFSDSVRDAPEMEDVQKEETSQPTGK